MTHIWIYSFVLIFSQILISVESVQSVQSSLRIQPEYDGLILENFFKNQRTYNHIYKCLLTNGTLSDFLHRSCDAIGRWLKSRIYRGLHGDCTACTRKQKLSMNGLAQYLQRNNPKFVEEILLQYYEPPTNEIEQKSTEATPDDSQERNNIFKRYKELLDTPKSNTSFVIPIFPRSHRNK